MCTLCLQKQVVLSCNLRPSGFDYYKIEDNLPLLPPTVEQLLSQKPSEKAAWRSRATPSLIPPKKDILLHESCSFSEPRFVLFCATLAQRGHCYSQEEGGHKVVSGHWAVFGRQNIATLTSSVSFTCSALRPVTGLNLDEGIFIFLFV